MKKTLKQIYALIMVLCMLLTTVTGAFADEAEVNVTVVESTEVAKTVIEPQADESAVEEAHVHEYQENSTIREGSCKDGTTTIVKMVCSCGDSKFVTKAATHQWKVVDTKVATCGEAGYVESVCEICEKTNTEVLPATGEHEWVPGSKIPASCTEPEMVGEKCDVCGAAGKTSVVEGSEPAGHKYALDKDAEEYKDPTCTEDGYAVYTCSVCDGSYGEVVPAFGHQWDDGEYIAPDCEHTNGVVYECEECGETWFDTDLGEMSEKALGHNFEFVETVEATCKEGGYDLYACTRCDKEEKRNKTEVVTDAHVAVLDGDPLREATCTTTGVGKYVCAVCGKSLGYKTIPAGHEWELNEEKSEAATCGEDGVEFYECANCDETKEVVVEATGKHTFEEKEIPATCTEPAKMGQVCKDCGAEGETEEIEGEEALGHDFSKKYESEDEEVTSKDPTCTEDGFIIMQCSRCDETNTEVIDATGHKEVEKILPADCENNERIAVTCSVCEAELSSEDVPGGKKATGHDYKETVVPATCAEGGYTLHVCANCEDSYETDETEADPDAHVAELVSTLREATCSTTGIGKYECSECHTALGYKTIAKLPHTLDTGKVTKESTCTEEGELTATCKICGQTATEKIDALGHSYGSEMVDDELNAIVKVCERCKDVVVVEYLGHEHTEVTVPGKEATCTEAGSTDAVVCSVCNEVIKASKEIPAKGHIEVTVSGTEATCTEAGSTDAVVCSVCNTLISGGKTVPALGHNYVVTTVAPTPDTKGYDLHKCSVCGDEFKDNETEYERPKYTTVTATGSVKIRTKADTSGTYLGSMSAGKTATYLGEETNASTGTVWYHVQYGTVEGWISSKYAYAS